MNKYSKETLADLAEQAIHAFENPQNIFHPHVHLGVALLGAIFMMTQEEVLEKLRVLIHD